MTIEGATIRRGLCLELEILAGIEPPSEDAQELLEHRIARLSAALAGETPPDAETVIRDWYCTPAGADPARVALRKPESTTGDGTAQEARRVELRLVD